MSVTFRIKASEAHGRRLDPSFYSPQYKQLDEALASCCYDCYEIRDLRIEVFQGVSRNLLENDRIRLLKVKNILPDGSIDFGDTEPISDVSVNKILKDGDIISPFIGAAIKGYKFGYFEDRECERWTFDNNTGVFRSNDERVLSRYLWSFFQLEITHRQLDRIIGGGGVPYLGAEYAKRLKVILPPLPEQRKIVAELDAAYAAKRAADEKATKLLASIDDMVLKELGIAKLPKPDTSLSSRIFTVPAREVANATLAPDHYFDSIDFSKAKYPCERFIERIDIDPPCGFERITKLVPMESVSAEWCAIESIEDISPDATQGYSTIRGGDVIWARITPCMENGKSAVVEAEPSECFCGSTEFLVFRPKDGKVNPYYLQSLLHLKRFREVAAHHFTGTSGHQRVTADFFKAISIPIPPRSVQDRIASTASSIRAEARKLKADATAALDAAKRKIEEELMIKEN